MSLQKFQKSFLKTIDGENNLWLKTHIIPGGSLSIEQSIDVYRGDYVARLSEAIGESFESIWFVLGDEDFFKLSHDYIKNNPSQVRDLGSYGTNLPEYIVSTSYQEEFPFLSELARYEQTFWRFFHSDPVNAYDPFGQIAAEDLGHSRWLMPELSLLGSWDFDIPAIFAAREGIADESELDFEIPTACLMLKLDQNIKTFRLTNNQYSTLANLAEGATIEEALCGTPNEIQGLFALLKQQGIPLRRRFEGAS